MAQSDLLPAPSLPAPSDTLLPITGIDPTVSDLREHLLNAYGDTQPGPKGPPAPNLLITGQLGVSEEFASNAAAGVVSTSNAGSDFITQFNPVLNIVDTSQRLQVNITYAPVGMLYAKNRDFSQYEEQFNGSILATLLPGWLYLDMRGNAHQQSVYGGLGPTTTTLLAPNDRQTVESFSVSPYLNRSFGGTGTLQVGAGYSYSSSDTPGLDVTSQDEALGQYANSFLATERLFANFTTGENFDRFTDKISTDNSFYRGVGALAGGRRELLTDDASYAVTRLLCILGEAGYEDLSYPRSFYAYHGVIGSGGVRLTPSRGSSITAEYRYVDGIGSAYVEGSVQASARIRVFGGYSEGISTFQQDVQNTLLDGTTDATGAAASALLAAPLLDGSNAFGANQNLTRVRRLNLSVTYLGTFDTATLSVSQNRTAPIGSEVVSYDAQPTSGYFVSLTDRHELTPDLSLSGFVQYGANQTALADSQSGNTLTVSAGIDRTFTNTLSGYLRFTGTYVIGGSAFAAVGYRGASDNQSTVTLGAVKRF